MLTSPAVPNITSVGALEPRELCTFAGLLLPVIRRLNSVRVLPESLNSRRDVPLAYTTKLWVIQAVSLRITCYVQIVNQIHTRKTVAIQPTSAL